MADAKISLFDAIDANKRNSAILIFFLFIVFMAAVWALSYLFDLGMAGPIIGFIALSIYAVVAYYSGDRMVLALSGAHEVTAKEQPFLYNVVEGLALASAIPMPRLYVVDDPSPNAFATGRDPQHASLAVTSGLLKSMKREELEGVVAHEISHIGNYDIRFMTIAVVFIGAIAILSEIAWRSMWFGGRGRDDRRGGGSGFLVIIAIALMILAPISAELIRFAISRQREYLADANAAKLTRYPEGLASALEKIKTAAMPVQRASDATAPLYIASPFPSKMSFLFSTHPPIDERIKRLRAM
jgi:heat shock protein HtpX